MGPGCIDGLMEGDIKANGKTTIWKVTESIHGKMEGAIKANIKKIKSMGMGFMLGLMEEDIKDGGTQLSSLVLADTLCL